MDVNDQFASMRNSSFYKKKSNEKLKNILLSPFLKVYGTCTPPPPAHILPFIKLYMVPNNIKKNNEIFYAYQKQGTIYKRLNHVSFRSLKHNVWPSDV